VIHREGVSHGTSLVTGIKRYQEVNREKFATKWSDVLPDQFPPGEQFVFRARTRGNKKRILVIDEEVPRFDSQSGAFRIFSIMQILVDMDYEVIMLPRNARRIDPYTSELEALGIEVLGSLDQFWNYVVAIKEQIAAVWVSRPQVFGQFKDLLRKDLKGVPIIFDMVDLHQLREQRESQIKNAGEKFSESKVLEDMCIQEADYVIAVSDNEAEFARQRSSKQVVVVSNVHQVSEFRSGAPQSQSALFVGSFKHSPNLDGIVWFLNDVICQVVEAVPGFCLKIIGENPPDMLKKYESENVKILGWVPDLDPFLNGARVSVSPLRFGAGVKGKISQALSFGLPVVTTSIGSEGMSLTDGFDSFIRDSADGFAEAVIQLISDNSLWNQLSRNGLKTAEIHFGVQVARDQVKNLFQLIDKGR
jgi:glycosyltransferase involved in cell wall biosynthesis